MPRKKSKLIEIEKEISEKFKLRDMLQVIIGASILAIPVGFTEETWKLGSALPLTNVLIFIAISLLFISVFVYNMYHKTRMKETFNDYLVRVVGTYTLSFIVVATLLTLIQVAPWTTDFLLAFKRTALVTFPSSLSAAVLDTLR